MDFAEGALQSGYLSENFRLFHLKDTKRTDKGYHFHEFDKIVVLISGDVKYIIEGKTYTLIPESVLFVKRNKIHKPDILPGVPYERYIIFIKPGFLSKYNSAEINLEKCFESENILINPGEKDKSELLSLLKKTESAVNSDEFASSLLKDALFLELIIMLDRMSQRCGENGIFINEKIIPAINYIADNPDKTPDISYLSKLCCMSRYHFMRKFKEATGYSAHSFIMQKKMTRAAEMILNGESAKEASISLGFEDYGSFLRAFRNIFQVSPSEYTHKNPLSVNIKVAE